MEIRLNLVLWGSASGVFSDSGQRLGSSISESVALGDLDGDDDLDAFVGNRAPFHDKVWLNDGLGVFSDSGQSLSTEFSIGVALGDLDGDEDLDAFIANLGSPNTIWLNDGLGVFSDSGQDLGSSDSFDVRLADLDADGDLDAFVANNNQPNTVCWNNGSGVFTDSGQRLGDSNSRRASLADLEGDGDFDAFVANGFQPNTVWFYNPPTRRAVADALAAAGLDPAQTPPEVIDALNTADEAGLLDVIPPGTTTKGNLRLKPGAAVVLGVGSTVDGNIRRGRPTNSTVVIGDDGFVNGRIIKVALMYAGGSNAEVNRDIKSDELLVGPGAYVRFNRIEEVRSLVAMLDIKQGGTAVFDENLRVKDHLALGPAASLSVAGDLRCDSEASATIHPTANVAIGGRNRCRRALR